MPIKSQACMSIPSSPSLGVCVRYFGLLFLTLSLVCRVDGYTTLPSAITPNQRTLGHVQPANHFPRQNHNAPLTQRSLKPKSFDKETTKSVIKRLWFLPLLSLLSGLTPACRIISESHVSRLPDCPIAHDMDTHLLWPAVASDATGLVPSVFRTPVGAVTDESLYGVDWGSVWSVYFGRVGLSMGISVAVMVCIAYLLSQDGDGDELDSKVDAF